MQIFCFHRHVGSVLAQHWQHLLGSLLVCSPSPALGGLCCSHSLGQFSFQPCFNQNSTEPVRRKVWKELLEAFQRGVYRMCSSLSILPGHREGQGRAGWVCCRVLPWLTAPRLLDTKACSTLPRPASAGFSLAMTAIPAEVIPRVGSFLCWPFREFVSPSSVAADVCIQVIL